jgi:hypothetical protein
VAHNGRHVAYQQNLGEARCLFDQVQAEIAHRAGRALRRRSTSCNACA